MLSNSVKMLVDSCRRVRSERTVLQPPTQGVGISHRASKRCFPFSLRQILFQGSSCVFLWEYRYQYRLLLSFIIFDLIYFRCTSSCAAQRALGVNNDPTQNRTYFIERKHASHINILQSKCAWFCKAFRW